MDETNTRRIVQEELRSTGGVVPRHIHNGVDSPRIDTQNTVGNLETTTAPVNVGLSGSPSSGQTLVATDSTHATWQTPTSPTSIISPSLTASEDITAGQAVAISDGTEITLASQTLSVSNSAHSNVIGPLNNGTHWGAMTFTVPTTGYITSVSFTSRQTQNGGQPAATSTLSIRATSSGDPTGADLDSGTNTDNSYSGSMQQRTYTLTGAVVLTAGTVYALVWQVSAGTYEIYDNRESTDGGSTWSTPSINQTPAHVISYKKVPTTGQLILASAAYNDTQTKGFIGFATASIASGVAGTPTVGGTATGLSGLTAGTQYYLGDTRGAIASSAGTNTRKVGIGMSSTSILVTNIW